MGGFDFYSAIKDFGFPVAIAALLVWNLISLNKSLTGANERLLGEIAKLRDILSRQAIRIEEQSKLVDQNEKLVNAIQDREAKSFKLVETLLSARLESDRAGKEVSDGFK